MLFRSKKVLALVQADLKHHPDRPSFPHSNNPPSYTSRVPSHDASFRGYQPSPENFRSDRCIFCGSRLKSHLPRTCTATSYANGTPCHLSRHNPSGIKTSSTGKCYCFSWNGSSGCNQNPCRRGEHLCSLCGSTKHNAQQCDIVP